MRRYLLAILFIGCLTKNLFAQGIFDPGSGSINLNTETTGTLNVNRGGTSKASISTNSLLIGNGTSAPNEISGTADQVLRIHGVGGAPAFGAIDLSKLAAVSGTLSNANTTGTNGNVASTLVLRDAGGNFSAGTITAALTGNASTATALAADPSDCAANRFAMAINASGTLTCTQVDIVNGTTGTLTAVRGGTGQTGFAIGDLLYGDTATTLAKLADVATGNALISGGVGVAPSWGKIGLTTHISGTLAIANGGTNLTSYTKGDILYASDTNILGSLADVASGSVLISGGVGALPSFSSSPTINTSVTSPKIIGGSAVGSTLDIQSTSAVGTTDYVRILVGNNGATESARFYHSGVVGIGTGSTTPGATLQVDATGGASLRISRLSQSATSFLQFDADAIAAYMSTGDASMPLIFRINNVEKWRISTGGNWITGTDGGVDIGVSGATRPGNIRAKTQIIIGADPATALTGSLFISGVTQASLGTPSDGTFIFCSDCTVANPCAGGGNGALAKRLNATWVCN